MSSNSSLLLTFFQSISFSSEIFWIFVLIVATGPTIFISNIKAVISESRVVNKNPA